VTSRAANGRGADAGAAPYYRPDLARIHHEGFGFHADACAPGLLDLLEPVRQRGGTVLELGCGSGLLTRHLVGHGLQVIATDASPAMLDLARNTVPGVDLRRLTLPDDPLPAADAVVGVGHPLNYLPDLPAVQRALIAIASALRPGGVLGLDICDLSWGAARVDQPAFGRATDDWALITEFSVPSPDRYVRELTTFVRGDDGCWRRGHERHDNVLVDTAAIPGLLAAHGVEARIGAAFGSATLPVGLHTVIGQTANRRAAA